MWNQCVGDLRKLSTTVRNQITEELTTAKWEALPHELREKAEHPLTVNLCDLISECTSEDGHTLIPISRLANMLSLPSRDRLTPKMSRQLTETIEHVGYCIEPDFRLTNQAYKWNDKVTVFLRLHDDQPNPERYRVSSCMLRLGIHVAASDGQIDPEEVSAIARAVEQMFNLNEHEHRRMTALRQLLSEIGADISNISRVTKTLTHLEREAIGKLLLALVVVDGVVTKDEIRAVRKCYRTLGFTKDEIEHALGSLQSYQTGEPVTIRPGKKPKAGEPIPQPIEELKLNRQAIAAIMTDTKEVAQMLAEALAEKDDAEDDEHLAPLPEAESEANTPEPADQSEATGTDSPPRHGELFEVLITKSKWDMSDLDTLAREQGTMLSGALDALNEWATEKYGGQLFVEDGSYLYVEQEYLVDEG